MSDLPDPIPVPPSGAELRERSIELLEFPKVREALAEHTRSPMSREQALGLRPSYNAAAVADLQQETAEAARLVDGGADLTLSRDPRPLLERAAMHGVLAGDELIAVADALDLVRKAKALGGSERGKTPLLRNLTRNIADLRPLEREIRGKLTPFGELKDDATPMLRQFRRESRDAYQSASSSIQAVMDTDAAAEALQDRLFTVRGDRLVLPIKADFKGKIPGIVHGVSDSGATLFIEPLANVSKTNRWREAAAAEQEAEVRILRQLSASVSRRAVEASRALEITARLDAALAKARYAKTYNGVTLSEHADHVDLVEGRHPLLGSAAVPVTLALRPPVSVLIVTGPNTGGKTVALKTLGLMALMRQSGMMPPCDPATKLPLFDGVYADIGDQQSIERAVSSFGSHVTAIAGVLAHATPNSLVLLDELGASTDPAEGSALAKAVVARLVERGAPTVVTTHHRSLAGFADEQEGVENASVELHPVTLRPTYKLTMGLPGRSYAMDIAARIGLDAGVIETAHRYLDPRDREVENLLASIQQERYSAREKLDEAEAERAKAARLSAELERKIEELEAAQATVVEEARAELLAEAKRVQGRLRQAASAAEWQTFRGEPPPPRVIEQASDDVADVQRSVRSKVWGKSPSPSRRKAKLRVGETVEIGSFGFTGVVLTEADASERIEVQVGSARLKLDASRLRRSGEPVVEREGRSSISLAYPQATPRVSEEIDLRGARVHEALEELDRRLDAAVAQGLSNVRIVHGKGTGALRQAVWRHLAGNGVVGNYAFAPTERGGDGATEVELV